MVSPDLNAKIKALEQQLKLYGAVFQRLDVGVHVIDLEQNFGDKIQFQSLVQDQFVVCSQLNEMTTELYLSSAHIGVSSRRTGMLLEDIYLHQKQLSRQVFLRCQHYSTALQILQQHPQAILTIPEMILKHLSISQKLKIFTVPVDLPLINMGMYWHKDLQENSRHYFLRQVSLRHKVLQRHDSTYHRELLR